MLTQIGENMKKQLLLVSAVLGLTTASFATENEKMEGGRTISSSTVLGIDEANERTSELTQEQLLGCEVMKNVANKFSLDDDAKKLGFAMGYNAFEKADKGEIFNNMIQSLEQQLDAQHKATLNGILGNSFSKLTDFITINKPDEKEDKSLYNSATKQLSDLKVKVANGQEIAENDMNNIVSFFIEAGDVAGYVDEGSDNVGNMTVFFNRMIEGMAFSASENIKLEKASFEARKEISKALLETFAAQEKANLESWVAQEKSKISQEFEEKSRILETREREFEERSQGLRRTNAEMSEDFFVEDNPINLNTSKLLKKDIKNVNAPKETETPVEKPVVEKTVEVKPVEKQEPAKRVRRTLK